MKMIKLSDGTKIWGILGLEAQVLDDHVSGYFNHGIEVKDGDTVFDVGANIGVFGVRTIQRGSNIRVFAFEPIPTIYKCLQKNAARFDPSRFHTLHCGISNQAGEVLFTYYPNSPALSTFKPEHWDEDALLDAVEGSVRNPPKHMWYTRYLPLFMIKWFAKRIRKNATQFSCQLRTISEVIDEHQVKQVDLLKIDCEGAELECLQGIIPSDWDKIQQVLVEVHDVNNALNKVKTLLNEMGLTQQVIEQEDALKSTQLFNIFARR